MRTSAAACGASIVVALLAACGPSDAPGGRALTEISTPGPTQKTVTAGDGWQQVTGSPLSARSSSSVTWVADRFVVVGGDDGPPCPPDGGLRVPRRVRR